MVLVGVTLRPTVSIRMVAVKAARAISANNVFIILILEDWILNLSSKFGLKQRIEK